MIRLALCLCMISVSAFSQKIGVGIKGGLVLTDSFQNFAPDNRRTDESKRYMAGPMVEVEFARGLGIEVDALYRRLGYTDVFNAGGFSGVDRERDHTWEIPVLGKYRFGSHSVRPFVASGIAFRTIHGSAQGTFQNPPNLLGAPGMVVQSSRNTDYSTQSGFVVGGGIEWSVNRFHIAPEFRYTRWSGQFADSGPSGSFRASTQDQAAVMIGLSWR